MSSSMSLNEASSSAAHPPPSALPSNPDPGLDTNSTAAQAQAQAQAQSTPPLPTAFRQGGFTPTPDTIYTYNIPAPKPTLTVPPDHPFRTTPDGYPTVSPSPAAQRATLSAPPGFADPRVTAFVAHWARIYTTIGGTEDGQMQLRQLCGMHGLAMYGSTGRLVDRLVDRAVRDAARGWCEISVSCGV
ncbi:hypothetical protein PMIN04_011462 [Paraphaeosphaeria minitans]